MREVGNHLRLSLLIFFNSKGRQLLWEAQKNYTMKFVRAHHFRWPDITFPCFNHGKIFSEIQELQGKSNYKNFPFEDFPLSLVFITKIIRNTNNMKQRWFIYSGWSLSKDSSTPRPVVTQLSGTGDPGQWDHSRIQTHNLWIESWMF